MSAKQLHLAEVSKHTTEGDLWIIIDRKVYDVSKFADEHPGGVDIFLGVAGDDATNGFNSIGHSDSAKEMLKDLYLGEVHPEDAIKLKAPIQGSKSNMAGIVFVFILLGTCLLLVFRSLIFG